MVCGMTIGFRNISEIASLALRSVKSKVLVYAVTIGKNAQNNPINRKLVVWPAFLSMDAPSVILELIEKYPEFRELYGQIYEIFRNVEDVMGLFSKELPELDRNTAQYKQCANACIYWDATETLHLERQK